MTFGRDVIGLLLSAALLATPGCDDKSRAGAPHVMASAEPIGLASCAACGMVVREQPAPRGQVVHRDGTRVFLCSVGDLVQYLQSPSPHGDATDVFVEVLAPGEEPSKKDTAEHPWVRAVDARYVVGVAREGVMGRPVLAYRSPAEAEAAQKRLGGQTLGLEAMKKWVLER